MICCIWLLSNEKEISCNQSTATNSHKCAAGLRISSKPTHVEHFTFLLCYFTEPQQWRSYSSYFSNKLKLAAYCFSKSSDQSRSSLTVRYLLKFRNSNLRFCCFLLYKPWKPRTQQIWAPDGTQVHSIWSTKRTLYPQRHQLSDSTGRLLTVFNPKTNQSTMTCWIATR